MARHAKNCCAMLALLLLLSTLYGCTKNTNHSSIPTTTATTTYPSIRYYAFYVDPPPKKYTSMGYLDQDADYALLGTVAGISFEACPYRPEAPDAGYGIQTVYTVEVSHYFKGDGGETVTLVVPYGIPEGGIRYDLSDELKAQQRALAWEYGIEEIWYPDPFPMVLALGETYALLLCEGEDGRMVNVNPAQYAFNIKDEYASQHNLCYEDFLIYYNYYGNKLED